MVAMGASLSDASQQQSVDVLEVFVKGGES
jgi:hypothetical protein